MKVKGRHVLLCDCEGTMTINPKRLAGALDADSPHLHTHLCRAQIESFKAKIEAGKPLLVCCTQEAPLFEEVASELHADHDVRYVNIRERAGWSDQGGQAHAKMAALIAEAALELEPSLSVPVRSNGAVLVYGDGQPALDAAQRLAERLSVSCLLTSATDIIPPERMDVPVFRGTIRRASGHIGAFTVMVDGYAAYSPSARASLAFEHARDPVELNCDLLLDLSGNSPLFPAPAQRDGYIRVDPSDRLQLERALFDLADLVGEFDKPRYVRVNTSICAHARNGIVGCDLCLTACPTSAITPDADAVSVDPYICAGHGACASVCPTGAVTFDLPRGEAILRRLKTLTQVYASAGGSHMVLAVHNPRFGNEMISVLSRSGRGLPAHVVPFAVNEITQIGLDFILTALAFGVSQIRILSGPEHKGALDALHHHAQCAETIMSELGYDGLRVVVDDENDPAIFEAKLYGTMPPAPVAAADYRVRDAKRPMLRAALQHLHAQAPSPVDVLDLADGAPFGTVILDQDRCTLCLACVGACPTSALGDLPERPQLNFIEADCVQCGLCRATCPENAITLVQRLNFAEAARNKVVLKAEEPFHCLRCDRPFASRSTIEALLSKLAGHPMYAQPGRLDILKLCEDCRIKAQFESNTDLFAAGPRRPPRTTEDYLRARGTADPDE